MLYRAFGFVFLAFFVAVCTPAVHAQSKSVVTIVGGEARTPAYELFGRVVRETLDASSVGNVEYFQEFLDNARFPGPENELALAEYLRKRYADKKIDLLVVWDPAAVRFLAKFGERIYPGVPVVFGAVRAASLAPMELPAHFVGVPVELEPAATIGMALALRPGARELVLVTGTAELDRAWEAVIRGTKLPPGVRLRVLSGLSIEAIESELAKLGPEAVVISGTFRLDGAGRAFPGGMFFLRRVTKVTGAPIFHVLDIGVGNGSTGNYTTPLEAVAAQAGDIARQLLEGTPPRSVVLPPPSPPVPSVDWRELRRWGIDEAKLPPGSIIRFREPSFWDRYRYHVLAIAALILLETALVAGLLLQRRLRRRVERELRQTQKTMQLAANAAQLVMWTWDVAHDEIWVSDGSTQLSGQMPPGQRTLAKFLETIHEEDRVAVERAIKRALVDDGIYESEYRVVDANGTRWFAVRGRVERTNDVPGLLRGIALDITRRKEAELDAQQQRNELAHLSRVTMLGELSGSVAHELNQPLMAILSNAQAARMFIEQEKVDLEEVGAILDDIIEDDKRAGEIIWGLRRMLKKEDVIHKRLPVNDLVQEVLRMMRSDLLNRGVTVDLGLAVGVPAIQGDPMQLQQVLLNLILNACDSMAAMPKDGRVLEVRTASAGATVAVSVADRGTGIAPKSLQAIFTPFFTTKKHGLGLGLSVCSSIISAHGGELHASNNAGPGATFTFTLSAEAVALA